VLIGCGDSGKPGGPGVKPGKDKSNVLGPSEETFTLDVPNLSTTLKQGESKNVSISLNRGKDFDEDVTLSFENLPKGVTIDPSKPKIGAGDKEAKLTLKAADDAALGDFAVKVTGHPTKGEDATNDLKIKVEQK
jgi:uncharacterized membrane protein